MSSGRGCIDMLLIPIGTTDVNGISHGLAGAEQFAPAFLFRYEL
jgi:hypothetical protein